MAARAVSHDTLISRHPPDGDLDEAEITAFNGFWQCQFLGTGLLCPRAERWKMSISSSSRHPSPMVLEHTTTERLTPTQDQVAAAVPRSAAECQRINAVRRRLKEIWADEHARWLKRDLSAKQYVYLWVGGIYVHTKRNASSSSLGRHRTAKKNWSV
jgi:hypothetical protein